MTESVLGVNIFYIIMQKKHVSLINEHLFNILKVLVFTIQTEKYNPLFNKFLCKLYSCGVVHNPQKKHHEMINMISMLCNVALFSN